MGGEGSMQGMADSLRGNKGLRRKVSFFSKQRSFQNRKNEYFKAAGGKLKLRNATKEELAEIRRKVYKQRIKDNLIIILVFLIVVVPIGVFTYHAYQSRIDTNKEIEQEFRKQHTEEYLFYISEGDKYVEEGSWDNAIFQYKEAIEVFPNDYDPHYRLAYAYVYKCRNEKTDCDFANETVTILLDKFPEKPELLELEKVLELIIDK